MDYLIKNSRDGTVRVIDVSWNRMLVGTGKKLMVQSNCWQKITQTVPYS